jgi:hypothetical protein
MMTRAPQSSHGSVRRGHSGGAEFSRECQGNRSCFVWPTGYTFGVFDCFFQEPAMFSPKRLFAASAVSLLLSGTAHAALTAEQVWAGWQANASFAGLNLVAENTRKEGSVLTLSNITVRPTLGTADAVGTIAQIAMTEKPDGSVTIALAPAFSLPYDVDGQKGALTITHQNFGLTAREAAGGTAYDYSGQSLTITAIYSGSAEALDGSGPKPASLDANYALTNPRGTYSDTPGANRTFRVTVLSDGLDFRLDQVDPTLGQNTKQSGTAEAFDFDFEFTLPATRDLTTIAGPADFGAAVADGLAFKMTGTQGASQQTLIEAGDLLAYTADITSAPSTFALLADRNGFDMNASMGGFTAGVTSPDMPFPMLNLKADDLSMAFQFPMVGNRMQDFRYMIKMGNFTINEDVWALFDPGKTLPRDPATLAVDLTGKVAMDIFEMIQAQDEGREPPVPKIESLNVVDLKLAAAGASVAGTGAFTFDNTTDVPKPNGASDLTVTGGNALINNLIAIGLLTQEDATGARMAMAMFMEPGAGDDVLTSKIEARPDGSIYVNGQRMQ